MNDFFGDIAIVEKDGGLAIVEGPKKLTFPLKHYDRDTFTYETAGENAVGRSGVTFTIGPDGQATQVVVENLNVHGEGTFKRVSTPERTSQKRVKTSLGQFCRSHQHRRWAQDVSRVQWLRQPDGDSRIGLQK